MTFFARDVCVQPGQRESRLGMVKGLGRFPILHVVASRALRPKLAFVRIAMARRAIRRKPHERFRQILLLNQCAFAGHKIRRRVTLLASHRRMPALQLEAGLRVIKFLRRNGPVNQIEVFPVVFQVAFHAILAVRIGHLQQAMKAMLTGDVLRNLFVAIDALEGGRAGAKHVA